jgi:hypothetical protein
MGNFGEHSNVKINGFGDATFAATFECSWTTLSGRPSTLIITNPGENELTVAVSGAPDEIDAVGPDGSTKKLNGRWTIKPKQPAARVLASNDFRATTVTIVNQSSAETDCKVVATV